MIQKYECSETGKWLNYYVRHGANFYNLHNISYLIGRGSRNPFIYLWRNIPNNHKWTNPDSTGAAKYVNKLGVDFIEKRCKLSAYEKKGFTTVRNLINSIEKLEETVMETFDMDYVSTLGEDSKLTWGVDNGVPWFCAVDVLSSMGFTKEGNSIKEFEGKTILKQVVPNRTSQGYLFWSEDSFKQLRQCFSELCPSKLEYFDNTEAILHLVGLEIKGKIESDVGEGFTEDYYLKSSLTEEQICLLRTMGWGERELIVEFVGKKKVMFNNKKISVKDLPDRLYKDLGVARIISEFETSIDNLVKGKSLVTKEDLNTLVDKGYVHPRTYKYLKHLGYKKCGKGNWAKSFSVQHDNQGSPPVYPHTKDTQSLIANTKSIRKVDFMEVWNSNKPDSLYFNASKWFKCNLEGKEISPTCRSNFLLYVGCIPFTPESSGFPRQMKLDPHDTTKNGTRGWWITPLGFEVGITPDMNATEAKQVRSNYMKSSESEVEDIVTVTEETKERNMLIIYKELIREDGLFSKKQVWVDKTMQVKFEDLEATIKSFGEYKQTIAIFEM